MRDAPIRFVPGSQTGHVSLAHQFIERTAQTAQHAARRLPGLLRADVIDDAGKLIPGDRIGTVLIPAVKL